MGEITIRQPHAESVLALFQENQFRFFIPESGGFAVVSPVEELFAWSRSFAGQHVGEIVAIKMGL